MSHSGLDSTFVALPLRLLTDAVRLRHAADDPGGVAEVSFYAERLLDIDDGLPKWAGDAEMSERLG